MICTANAPALQTDHLVDFQDSLVESLTDSNSLVDFLVDSLADQLVDSPVDSLAIPLTGSRFESQRVLMYLSHVSCLPYVSLMSPLCILMCLRVSIHIFCFPYNFSCSCFSYSPNWRNWWTSAIAAIERRSLGVQICRLFQPSLRCERFKILTSL